MKDKKNAVKYFWNENSCGEVLYLKGEDEIEAFKHQTAVRYRLEPYIRTFLPRHGLFMMIKATK